jgi:putative phosphoesterase
VSIGVLADVHANLPALEAVVEALRSRGVDRWVCAGDVVGYGPHPNECVARLRELDATTVLGNHDLIALGLLSDERCIPLARTTLAWTSEVLSEESRAWLRSLPRRVEQGDLLLAHGSPEDPERYVARRSDALEVLAATRARTVVLGHTHRPLLVAEGGRLLLNPGAVGQSRERRAVARAAVLELDTNRAVLVAVPYAVEQTRAALRQQGLPDGGPHLRPSALRATARALRALR